MSTDWYARVINQVRKLRRAKHKLQRKTMNVNAFFDLWDRFIDQFPELNFRVNFVNLLVHIPDFKISIDLSLPYQGINTKKLPKLFSYKKAVYGETYYGLCYVDPTDWMKFVVEFKRYVFTESLDYASARGYIEGFAEVADLYRYYLHDTATRIQLFIPLILEHIVCGFTICGKSKLSDTKETLEKEGVTLEYATTLYQLFTTKVKHAVQAHFAHICGLTPCGFSRAIPSNVKECNILAKVINYSIVATNAWHSAQGQMSRFLINITGTKLLQGATDDYSPKMEIYYDKMVLNTLISNIVNQILENENIDPMKRQLCVDLGKELVFGYYKKHTLYRKAIRYLDINEYVNYLINKYEQKGLPKDIIVKIIDALLLFAEYFINEAKTRYYKT